jgi:hypothetical protein
VIRRIHVGMRLAAPEDLRAKVDRVHEMLSSQSPIGGINLARFERASRRAHHSTGSGRNDIVQG